MRTIEQWRTSNQPKNMEIEGIPALQQRAATDAKKQRELPNSDDGAAASFDGMDREVDDEDDG